MRIPNPTAAVAVWLAGASLVSAEGRGISVPQNSIVSFTFIPRGAAAPVFVLGELSQGLSITWRSPNKTIVVTEAYIKTKEGGPNGGKILAFGSAQDDLRPPTQSIPADGAGLPTNIPSPTPSGTRRRDEGGELRLGAANVADALANTGNPDFIELQGKPTAHVFVRTQRALLTLQQFHQAPRGASLVPSCSMARTRLPS